MAKNNESDDVELNINFSKAVNERRKEAGLDPIEVTPSGPSGPETFDTTDDVIKPGEKIGDQPSATIGDQVESGQLADVARSATTKLTSPGGIEPSDVTKGKQTGGNLGPTPATEPTQEEQITSATKPTGQGARDGVLDPTGGRIRAGPQTEAEVAAALAEERLETQKFTARAPEAVPFVGGQELFTLKGQGRDVEVTPKREDGRITFDVEEREQFGHFDIPVTSGTPREFGGAPGGEVTFEEIFEGIQEQAVQGAEDITDPPRAKQRDNLFFDPGRDTPREKFVSGQVKGAAGFVTGVPLIGKEAIEFGAEAVDETISGRGGEFAGDVVSAGVGRGILVGEKAAEKPIETAGSVAGSGLISGGAIGAARKALGPTAGRATSVAIQPGEELAIAAARKGAIPTRAAEAVGDLSAETIRGEAKRFAEADRGQLQIGKQRPRGGDGDGGGGGGLETEADLVDVARAGEGLEPRSTERTPGFEAGTRPRGTERSRFSRTGQQREGFGTRPTTELERGRGGSEPGEELLERLDPPTAEADVGVGVGAKGEPGIPESDLGVADFLRLETGGALERAETAVAPPVTTEDPVTPGVIEAPVSPPVVNQAGQQIVAEAEVNEEVLGPALDEQTKTLLGERERTRTQERTRELGREDEIGLERTDVRAEPDVRAEELVEPRQDPRTEQELRQEPRQEPRAEPRQEPRIEPRIEPRTEVRQEPRQEPRTEFRFELSAEGDERKKEFFEPPDVDLGDFKKQFASPVAGPEFVATETIIGDDAIDPVGPAGEPGGLSPVGVGESSDTDFGLGEGDLNLGDESFF